MFVSKKSVAILLLCFLISGCTSANNENIQEFHGTNNEFFININLSTDKAVYSSYEDIIINLFITSSNNINNASIRVHGIQPYRYAYINSSKIINLQTGENTVIFNEKAPSCTSGCGGVFPGKYSITAELLFNNTIIENTITLTLTGD